jgi:thiol-disulfide isomerase/thioredoxin
MKQKLIAALLMLAALPVGAQKVKCVVNGVSDENGAKVFLVDRNARVMVGQAVVADGKFSITGEADKDALLAIGSENSSWSTLLFNDGTPVSVNLNDNTLKGSPVNERLVNYDLANATPNADLIAKIFKEERNTLIPFAFLMDFAEHFGKESLDSVVATKPVWVDYAPAKPMLDYLTKMLDERARKNAIIGQQFLDLEEADVDGNMHKLSEYVGKGRWVLVDFWASWCGPCRMEMPNVVAAYDKYHAKGFDVVGLSFDSKKEPWVKAIDDLKMPWVHLSDLKYWNTVAAKVYGVNSIPDNLLIDPQGKIVARGLRGATLQKKLQAIFGE